MIVAVTGATGFLGRRVVEQLVARGHSVRALVRSRATTPSAVEPVEGQLADPAALRLLCAGAQRLVHMASLGVQARDRDACAMVETNVKGTISVLDAARKAGVGTVILTGTVLEYRGGYADLGEDDSTESTDPYGASKSAAGLLARAFARNNGMSLMYLRLASMFGAGDDADKLVPQVLRALCSRTPIALTSGAQEREWMHVDDGAAAVAASVALAEGATLNIGTGVAFRVRHVLERLCATLDADPTVLRFGAKQARVGEPHRLVMNVDAAKRVLGWRNARSLDDLVAELAGSVKG